MNSLSTIKLGLAKKLRDKNYRHHFFKRRAQGEIASQIRELRLRRNLTQAHLAASMNTGQSAIARIEDAKYAGWSFLTLLRVAETLDVRLRVTLEPMEDVIAEYERKERPIMPIGEPIEALGGSVHEIAAHQGPHEYKAPVFPFGPSDPFGNLTERGAYTVEEITSQNFREKIPNQFSTSAFQNGETTN